MPLVKNRFGQEGYLSAQNVKHRNAIRDMRMSTHKLSIETGRYEKIPRESRLCTCCSERKIESEEHFIFECQNYKEERASMFKRIFGVNNIKGNMGSLKKVFGENDPVAINELGVRGHAWCWIVVNSVKIL